jgi:hypothetical protein
MSQLDGHKWKIVQESAQVIAMRKHQMKHVATTGVMPIHQGRKIKTRDPTSEKPVDVAPRAVIDGRW